MITEQKEQFPEFDDVEWFMVNAPRTIKAEFLDVIVELYPYRILLNEKMYVDGMVVRHRMAIISAYRDLKDFKVTWQLKQTDQHAEIKAQHKEALKKYDVVKVFSYVQSFVTYNACSTSRGEWYWEHQEKPDWNEGQKYELRYYNIDWNKLLSWSYADGEFVECEIGENYHFKGLLTEYVNNRVRVGGSTTPSNLCRIAPNVTIKDEWLTEVKK